MKPKNFYYLLAVLFLVAALIFGIIGFWQLCDALTSEQAFQDLEELIGGPTETPDVTQTEPTDDGGGKTPAVTGPEGPADGESAPPEESTGPVDDEAAEALTARELYQPLYERNNDFVGWIKIEGTRINYPVMQSVDRPDYYLKRGFDRSYSDYGVPYMDEACALGRSNNIIVYGHNMKNGSMFADLLKYESRDFWEDHPIIRFDTLTELGEYRIVCVFRFDANRDSFRFNGYTDMDETEFAEYRAACHRRQLYDTGITAEYGDQLLTLSTCEYTYDNGRLVVVAKKIG